MYYLVAAHSDIGTTKRANQDSICIRTAASPACGPVAMLVLCDGMGGLAKGELASAAVVRVFDAWFDERVGHYAAGPVDWEELEAEWAALLERCNREIAAYGGEGRRAIGTTFTGMLLLGPDFLAMHVGDSRLYRLAGGGAQCLTEDHSLVGRELARGRLTPEQALHDPRRHVLLQCIGAAGDIRPQALRGALAPGEACLLCSDGLWHEADGARIAAAVAGEKDADALREALVALTEYAKAQGEKDNISAAVVAARHGEG